MASTNSKEKLFLNDALLPVSEIGLLRHMNYRFNLISAVAVVSVSSNPMELKL